MSQPATTNATFYPCVGGPKDRQWISSNKSVFSIISRPIPPNHATTYIYRRCRCWGERLFSWPWRPWQAIATEAVPLPNEPPPCREERYVLTDVIPPYAPFPFFQHRRSFYLHESLTEADLLARIADSRILSNANAELVTIDPPIPRATIALPVYRLTKPTGRNEPCPCGSGRKFKRCCLVRQQTDLTQFELTLQAKVLEQRDKARAARLWQIDPPKQNPIRAPRRQGAKRSVRHGTP
jgi:hypothetical protein